jgi:hypothetical protein
MIPIYNHPNPTPAIEDALRGALLSLSQKEGYLDSKYRPILTEGFRYERSVMKGVQYVADEGGTYWHDYTEQKPHAPDPNQITLDLDMVEPTHDEQVARVIADQLGYTSVSNCMAMFREAVDQELLDGSVRDGRERLSCNDYSYEMLDLWEGMDDENV